MMLLGGLVLAGVGALASTETWAWALGRQAVTPGGRALVAWLASRRVLRPAYRVVVTYVGPYIRPTTLARRDA
jgi:hypothetical protein